ncbi:MAG: iron ABC transporter permease [Myxococcota bacterium]
MRRWPGVYLPALVVAALAVLPLTVLVRLAFEEPTFDARAWPLLANTVALAALTAMGATLIGVPLAVLTAFVRLPWDRAWLVVLAAPLALPSYLGAFAMVAAFGPGGEIEGLTGWRLPAVSGLPGATLVLVLYTYPFVLLTTRAALLGQDANLLHAARTLGMPWLESLRRIALPRAASSIAAGALLAALYALSDFGTPAIMNLDTFTRAIYVEYNAFGLSQAALLSLQLMAIVGVVLIVESRVASTREQPGAGATLHPSARILPAICASVAPIVGLALLLPVGVFSLWLWREGASHFDPKIAWNSARASLLAAGVAAAAGLPVAFAALRGRLGRTLERVTYLGFGIPGIVMGTALVYVGLGVPVLYQSLAMLVAAYVIRFLPLAVGSIRSSAEVLDAQLVGASRLLGAGSFETFRRVSVPLTSRGIVAGAALVFLEAMRELPATLLLAPTGFETLATYLWRVYEAGLFGRAAVPGLLLIVLSALGLAFLFSGEGMSRQSGNPRG